MFHIISIYLMYWYMKDLRPGGLLYTHLSNIDPAHRVSARGMGGMLDCGAWRVSRCCSTHGGGLPVPQEVEKMGVIWGYAACLVTLPLLTGAAAADINR